MCKFGANFAFDTATYERTNRCKTTSMSRTWRFEQNDDVTDGTWKTSASKKSLQGHNIDQSRAFFIMLAYWKVPAAFVAKVRDSSMIHVVLNWSSSFLLLLPPSMGWWFCRFWGFALLMNRVQKPTIYVLLKSPRALTQLRKEKLSPHAPSARPHGKKQLNSIDYESETP